jgi:hypothetical protein
MALPDGSAYPGVPAKTSSGVGNAPRIPVISGQSISITSYTPGSSRRITLNMTWSINYSYNAFITIYWSYSSSTTPGSGESIFNLPGSVSGTSRAANNVSCTSFTPGTTVYFFMEIAPNYPGAEKLRSSSVSQVI